jgi:signal peptidase I
MLAVNIGGRVHRQNQTSGAVRNRAPRSRGQSTLIFLRDLVLIFLVALLISFLVKTFLVRTFYIPSDSMTTTLVQNDRVLVNQLVPSPMSLQHGDVVVFRDPGNWLGEPAQEIGSNPVSDAVNAALAFVGLGAENNDHLIKRVIGLPGDVVACCSDSGQLTVNGVPLDEPYITIAPGQINAAPEEFEVTIPEGHVWVMGDNRYNSQDSAYHRNGPTGGFVPVENLVGRAMVISWPAARWTVLDNYPETFGDVAER